MDATIGNILDEVFVFLVNPDLIKEFLGGNNPYIYPKSQFAIAGTKAVFGEGLLFSEG